VLTIYKNFKFVRYNKLDNLLNYFSLILIFSMLNYLPQNYSYLKHHALLYYFPNTVIIILVM